MLKMYIYYIHRWFGRTSNNLMSIIHMILLAKDNNKNYSMIEHHLFSIKNNTKLESKKIIKDEDCFHRYINKLTLNKYKNIFNKHIDMKKTKKTKKYDICIHIRGGDIFNKPCNPYYTPLPLTFYQKYIGLNKDKSICVVYEDNKNPSINILKKQYPCVVFQSSDLLTDIFTLANCEIMILSTGTFFLTSFCISKTVKKVIYPEYLDKWFDTSDWGIEAERIEFPNYIKLGEWKNDESQHNLIINYKLK